MALIKDLKLNLIVLFIVILMSLLFLLVDYFRVNKQEKPIFCILSKSYEDGGTKEYLGCGYKVIVFNTTRWI